MIIFYVKGDKINIIITTFIVAIITIVAVIPIFTITFTIIFIVIIIIAIIIFTCGSASNVGGGEINCAPVLPLIWIFDEIFYNLFVCIFYAYFLKVLALISTSYFMRYLTLYLFYTLFIENLWLALISPGRAPIFLVYLLPAPVSPQRHDESWGTLEY